jgi:hypothetical protein
MTYDQLIALMTAWGRTAPEEHRDRVARFCGALSAEPEAIESAREAHERGRRELAFEEQQLSAIGDCKASARRAREP